MSDDCAGLHPGRPSGHRGATETRTAYLIKVETIVNAGKRAKTARKDTAMASNILMGFEGILLLQCLSKAVEPMM